MALVMTLIFLGVLAVAAILSTRRQLRDYHARRTEQKRLVLAQLEHERALDSRLLAKVEAERSHELATIKLDHEQQKIDLDRERFQLERFLAMTRIEVSQHGTYLLNQEQAALTLLAPIHKPDPKLLAGPAQAQEVQVQRPSQEMLLSHLQHNKFLVSPGVQASVGDVVIVDLLKVPHLKIIGSSGFGKSCLAAAILDQATLTNDTRHLQLALLDLEHKTSRLFEDRAHVAELQDGRRRVTMVATNADEVVTHLGILKKELDRRAALPERELYRNPVLLMYVEEMLSLQYEVVDQKLLTKMFAALTILAIRGRKYGMYLLSCMQSDYSTDELKVSQKQFRYRAAAAIDVPAARAAGFMNTDLIKDNFANGKPGQFVVEFPSFSNTVLAPDYDVRALLNRKEGIDDRDAGDFGLAPAPEIAPPLQLLPRTEKAPKPAREASEQGPKKSEDGDAKAWEAKVQEVRDLRARNWGKIAIIERVWWPVRSGSSKAFKAAQAEYERIVALLEHEAESEVR